MRLYIDEDAMASALVRALLERSFDVETAEERGMRGRSDEDHLAYAASVGRTLYSFNRRDYLRIHWRWFADGRTHAGVLLLGQRTDVGTQIRAIVDIAETRGQAGMRDYLKIL